MNKAQSFRAFKILVSLLALILRVVLELDDLSAPRSQFSGINREYTKFIEDEE